MLFEGDIVTQYEGISMTEEPSEAEYAVALNSGEFLLGISVPEKGKGMGSFVNRELRLPGYKRCNCRIVERNNSVYIQVTKTIAVDEELYTVYSRGYRIKNIY